MIQPCPPLSQLERLVKEQLDPVDDATLTRHVEECASCQALLEKLSGGRAAQEAPLGAEEETAAENVIRRLKERPPETTLRLRSSQPKDRSLPCVSGYEVLEEIGRGGMGVIYRARQQDLNRIVALKMIRASAATDSPALARLRTEASAVARLHHPNIVQIYEVGEHAGQPYLSLEFVDGGSLRQRLDGKPRPACDAAELIECVARAVDAAHRRGIVHRDLKPANILLQKKESTNHNAREVLEKPEDPPRNPVLSARLHDSWVNYIPKVADFGLAKLLNNDAASGEALTKTGEVVGTPSYMAPEQARAEGASVGPAVDVYALGAVLYELLTGRPPFVAETPLETLLQVVHDEPVSVARLCPSVPRDLATVTMKCLEKEPSRRYPTAGALADDLSRFREGRPVRARPVGHIGRARRWCRRNPVVAGLLASLALVFAAGSGVSLWQMREAQNSAAAEGEARQEADRQKVLAVQGEQSATALRLQAERVVALSRLDQGILHCRQGEIASGLLLLANSLEKADGVGADDLPHAIRCNITAWVRQLLQTTASPPNGSSLTSIAWAPDGRTVATGPVGNAWGKLGPAEVCFWDAATWKPVGKRLSHPYTVFGLAFSPDGRRLVVGGGDRVDPRQPGEVKLWDVATGEPVGMPLPHSARVQAVAFSPDGKTVLTGCWDGMVRRWDMATGRILGQPLPHVAMSLALFTSPDKKTACNDPKPLAPVLAVAFSPDGKTALTGGEDRFARLWDTATGKPLLSLPHAEVVHAVAFSPDGHSVLTGCGDHTARLWDAATGKRIGSPMMNRYPVLSVAFHPTKALLVTGGGLLNTEQFRPGEARFWDATTMKPVGTPLTSGGIVHAVAFSPDGRFVLTATEDGRARTTDVSRLHSLALTVRHGSDIRWVRFRPDGKALLTVTALKDRNRWGEARLWDAATGKPLGSPMPAHAVDLDGYAYIVYFSPDGKALWGGSSLAQDAATGHLLGPSLPPGAVSVPLPVFSPDGKRFVVLRDRAALLWDTAANKQVGLPLVHRGRLLAATFHPDGKSLLTASDDGLTSLWDLTIHRIISEPLHHDIPVKALSFASDGRTFLTFDSEKAVRQWETRTGRPIGTALRVPKDDNRYSDFHSMRFTPDGKQILLDVGQKLYIWDAASGQLITSFLITSHVCDPRVKFLGLLVGDMGAGPQGQARVWDVERRQFRSAALPGTYRCLDIHPTGRLLATGDEEMAGLWDAATARLVGPPLEHPSQLLALHFAPDGRRLLTCCGDGTARLWEVPSPVSGSVERVKLWLEVLTGKELDDSGAARPLQGQELERRRKQLNTGR